jgi:hypothetical protein
VVFGERWIPAGLALGVACLFKSFALVAPVGLAFVWTFGRRRFFHAGLAVAIALAVFALWPLFDPDPGSILRHFVLEENLGKLEGSGYFERLLGGPYALHWLWLGSFANAGLFAIPLLFVVVAAIRTRKNLPADERLLWLLVLSFLLVYSVPSQRQGNYLIPASPALAILIARRWKGFPVSRFRWFALPGALLAAALLSVVVGIRERILPAGAYASWQLAVPVVVLVLWIGLAVLPKAARYSFHAMVFASFLLIGLAVAPFEGPLGRFEPERVAFLKGKKVYVPSEFVSRHERHRFLCGSAIEGYDPRRRLDRRMRSGEHAVHPLGRDHRRVAQRADSTSDRATPPRWRIFIIATRAPGAAGDRGARTTATDGLIPKFQRHRSFAIALFMAASIRPSEDDALDIPAAKFMILLGDGIWSRA